VLPPSSERLMATTPTPPAPAGAAATAPPVPPRPVIVALLGLFVAATAVQTLAVVERISELAGTALGLAIGAVAVGMLLRSHWTAADCYLGPGRLSLRGALALAWLLVLWPFVLATGEWVGWDTARALTQALGGVAQELYFRAALLPLLVVLLSGRRWTALLLHAALFTVWHGGALLVTPYLVLLGTSCFYVPTERFGGRRCRSTRTWSRRRRPRWCCPSSP
jgi:hypothetical protein